LEFEIAYLSEARISHLQKFAYEKRWINEVEENIDVQIT